MTENITFPQTTYAGGKKKIVWYDATANTVHRPSTALKELDFDLRYENTVSFCST